MQELVEIGGHAALPAADLHQFLASIGRPAGLS
jgi:hypothetical protein